jgi:hypothetical protein
VTINLTTIIIVITLAIIKHIKKYKEFTEERAKRLYEDLLLQFLSSSNYNEFEASEKARSIIRKQCQLRNMPSWSWL